MGGEEKEKEGEEYEQMRYMTWNINGWKGEKGNRKIKRIHGEATRYDAFVLTETHVADEEEEREAFNKHFKEYHVFHVHAKRGREKGGKEKGEGKGGEKEKGSGGRRLGVAIGIKKRKVEAKDIEVKQEQDGEGGRWIVVTIKGMMTEPIHLWGIYAPVKTEVDRKKWMEKVGKEMKKKEGMRVVAVDFNFVWTPNGIKSGATARRGWKGRKSRGNGKWN